jgi:tyrosinase
MAGGSGTFAIPPGNLDNQWTSLEPFSSDGRGQFYTSAFSWKTSTFGYTYPEIQDWNQTPAQLKSNVTATINTMYNSQGSMKRAEGVGAKTKEWSIALNVSKYDLQGERFIVRVFLGTIPENPQTWSMSSGCMGSLSVFPPPHQGTGPYPIIITYSQVDLTKGLVKNGVDIGDVEAAVKWLTSNLTWAVQKVN